MPKIILISGEFNEDKDIFVNVFRNNAETQNKRVLVIRYGDIVEFICRKYLGWDGNKELHGRILLEMIEDELGRKKDPNIWVDCIMNIVKVISSFYDYILIPDVKFKNEISEWIYLSFDYISIRINRVDEDNTSYNNDLYLNQKKYINETSLDDYIFDYYITNKKISEDFEKEVIEIYNELESF